VADLSARSLDGIPEVGPGDDVGALILAALAPELPRADQLLAIAHTVVSKAEGAVVELERVRPGARARRLAAAQGKDARVVQVVLDESVELLRAERGVLIARTRHGFVCANAGVDISNAGGRERVVLLPTDPDASARRLRARLRELAATDRAPAVVITDTFGRAWRHGQTDVAVGVAGLRPLDDWRGRTDAGGQRLQATLLAIADAAAGVADLARAKDSRQPVVLIDGLGRFITAQDGPGAAELVRPFAEDLFR
jgi:coenzyme F420-0:L-glutamate ligase/coenzyme F420-1:gamma-L-glutamate ligase